MDRTGEAQQIAEDVALMARVAGRDAAALRALYDRHSALVYAVCLRIVRDREDAEQVLTDVFAEAWERPDRFDRSRGSAATYLTLVARSRALDHVRAERRRGRHTAALSQQVPSPPPHVAADAPAMAGEDRAAVVAALDALDENQRTVVSMSFYDGLSHGEIAEKLGRPVGTVKTQVRQGLIRMRDALRSYWEGSKGNP